MISHQKYLQEQLKNSAFRKAYEDELLLAQAAIEIAQQREEQGLTQEELARKAHLQLEEVSHLEEGNSQVPFLTFLKVSRVLNLS